MTFNLANFLTFSEISPVLITLPDGSKIHAKVSGIVQLSPFLSLSNVYIHEFKVNLIFVAKLFLFQL